MLFKKILIGVLLALSALFLGFQIFGMEVVAAGIRVLLIVILTVLYYIRVEPKHLLFLFFLITFSVAEILNFITWLVPLNPDDNIDFMYYFGNAFYITAYSLLITQVLKNLNLMEVIKKYPFHILILIILDVFCVVIVTDTAQSRLSFHEYYLEIFYNAVIMMLLTATLINYIHKNGKKAINLLIGSIFIFLSEVIQLAYFYVSDINLLNVFCSICLVLGFTFFYLQSELSYEPQEYGQYNDVAA